MNPDQRAEIARVLIALRRSRITVVPMPEDGKK